MGKYSETGDKADLDSHANQINPNNERRVGEDEEDYAAEYNFVNSRQI